MPKQSRPRAGLSREKVLDAAVALIDEHGLSALTMRRLGAALGVEAMTLYHYVPNKAALFDGVVERVLDAALGGVRVDGQGGWRAAVREFAHGYREELLRHPAVVQLVATRPVNSPRAFAVADRILGLLAEAGLPPGTALDLFNALGMFTIGHTLAEVGRPPGLDAGEAEEGGVRDADPETYPHLAAVVAAGEGLDFDARFAFVVDVLIDGYAAAASA